MDNDAKERIARHYNRQARRYDQPKPAERSFGIAELRKQLIDQANGQTLEVAVGTGKNVPYYPQNVQLTGIDLSQATLELAHAKATDRGLAATFQLMDAEQLAFTDNSFDTVISTLSLCTFPNPVFALGEMARVCRPNGRILLLEHGRSSQPFVGWLQDILAPINYRATTCHWNRPIDHLVSQAPIVIDHQRTDRMGILLSIVGHPEKRAS